ncbi:hypothetical protein B0J18DRAFT_64546 [Chaetomium sp. MPI-SDFR-AT-0129]|nr:hypothetical protein B0J18DRAFT_64546 [Chaetomium sp. MPI-SDFR-AT-0129]
MAGGPVHNPCHRPRASQQDQQACPAVDGKLILFFLGREERRKKMSNPLSFCLESCSETNHNPLPSRKIINQSDVETPLNLTHLQFSKWIDVFLIVFNYQKKKNFFWRLLFLTVILPPARAADSELFSVEISQSPTRCLWGIAAPSTPPSPFFGSSTEQHPLFSSCWGRGSIPHWTLLVVLVVVVFVHPFSGLAQPALQRQPTAHDYIISYDTNLVLCEGPPSIRQPQVPGPAPLSIPGSPIRSEYGPREETKINCAFRKLEKRAKQSRRDAHR